MSWHIGMARRAQAQQQVSQVAMPLAAAPSADRKQHTLHHMLGLPCNTPHLAQRAHAILGAVPLLHPALH
jgi:hypothetical protein